MKKERDTEHVLSFKEETVKRLLMPILIIPLLALVLIGCDQDMRNSVVGFLKPMGNNAYLDSGMAPTNTANAAAASNQIAGLGNTEESKGKVNDEKKIPNTVFGVEVDLSANPDINQNTTFLAPQSKDAQEELKDQLGEALNSPSQKEELKKEMKKPASDEQKAAAKGTVGAFNTVLESIKTESGGDKLDFLDNLKLPEIKDEDELTQGDMLMLQLMTDMVKNTVDTLTGLSEDGDLKKFDGGTLNEEGINKVMGIVDDALFAAQMAEELSGASSIDFTGSLDLTELLENIGGKGRNRIQARDGGDDDFLEDIIPTLFRVSGDVTKMMGAKIVGDGVQIDPKMYRTFLTMTKSYRSSLEYAFGFGFDAEQMKRHRFANAMHIDLSSIIKYLLAVAVTEHDEYLKTKSKSSRTLIEDFLTANDRAFVTGIKPEDMEGFKINPPREEDEAKAIYEGFGDYLKGKNLEETIKATLQGIVSFTAVGGLFDEAIDDFSFDEIFKD